jgi:hypothetical protein
LRSDESLSRQLVVRKRLEGFHKENDPLLAHYGQRDVRHRHRVVGLAVPP